MAEVVLSRQFAGRYSGLDRCFARAVLKRLERGEDLDTARQAFLDRLFSRANR